MITETEIVATQIYTYTSYEFIGLATGFIRIALHWLKLEVQFDEVLSSQSTRNRTLSKTSAYKCYVIYIVVLLFKTVPPRVSEDESHAGGAGDGEVLLSYWPHPHVQVPLIRIMTCKLHTQNALN